MSRIIIQTIPHENQRYHTVGDWFRRDGDLIINVSEMKDGRYELLVAVHELIEVLVCEHRGITQQEVDKFDMSFNGEHEPGDDPNSPYYKEHGLASAVERMLASVLDVNWQEYDEAVNAL